MLHLWCRSKLRLRFNPWPGHSMHRGCSQKERKKSGKDRTFWHQWLLVTAEEGTGTRAPHSTYVWVPLFSFLPLPFFPSSRSSLQPFSSTLSLSYFHLSSCQLSLSSYNALSQPVIWVRETLTTRHPARRDEPRKHGPSPGGMRGPKGRRTSGGDDSHVVLGCQRAVWFFPTKEKLGKVSSGKVP